MESRNASAGGERCDWCKSDPDYIAYHDNEWGVPEKDERALFERLVLEGMQAGLSWLTILRKREGYRRAFAGFDPQRVAAFDAARVEGLLADPAIVRHRGKVESTIHNARCILSLWDAGRTLSALSWESVGGEARVNRWRNLGEVPAETAESRDLSRRVPYRGPNDEVGQLARAFNRMAQNLEKIERLRRSLMIDVAHELRTPLTNIRGYLEALNDRVLPFSTETFTLLQNETRRLAELVEDVLQLARADAAHGQLDRQPVDLVDEVKTTLDYFARTFDEKSVTVKFHSSHEALIIQADRRRMARVLRNLTDNAVRYTPAGGTVDIRLDADSRQVWIDFINSAERLVATDLPHLFERFYRGEKSRSRQHGGAGIGLAIVKELVEAHDGQVAAALVDGRLRIRLTLPITPGQKAASI